MMQFNCNTLNSAGQDAKWRELHEVALQVIINHLRCHRGDIYMELFKLTGLVFSFPFMPWKAIFQLLPRCWRGVE